MNAHFQTCQSIFWNRNCYLTTIIVLSKQLTWQVKNKYVKFIKGAISELPFHRWLWARKGDISLPFVLWGRVFSPSLPIFGHFQKNMPTYILELELPFDTACTIVPSKQLTWQMKNNYVNLIKGAPVLDASRKGSMGALPSHSFQAFHLPFQQSSKASS